MVGMSARGSGRSRAEPGGRRSIGAWLRRVHGVRATRWFAATITVAALGSCMPPDRPDVLSLALPVTALSLLEPDTVRTHVLHPGVVYRYLWSDSGPWAVHLIQAMVDRRCDLEFAVLRAEAREAGRDGREPVSAMVARSADRVLAAVNADFFTPAGGAVGAEVVDGMVRAAVPRPTFAWRRGAAPWMGTPQVTSDAVLFGWSVNRDDGDAATEAVGGFPDLIDRGERVGDLEVGDRPAFAAVRHPRTAVGYDSRSGTVWLVVVDGRQPSHSNGMTLPELASLFEALGADEAINFDGGGSTALVVGSVAVNRPSEPSGERPVANGLALIQHPRGCEA